MLLVNPIRDGMNCRAGGPGRSPSGAARWSRPPGLRAATLAGDAPLVNLYDVTETAEALHQA